MPSAAPADEPPRGSNFKIMHYLEPLTRLGAVLFALSYGAGFVIVTLHHSQFGIAEFSLLRVRVLAAGVLFIALSLLPIIVAARVFGIFGLDSERAVPIKHKPGDWACPLG